MIFKLIRRYQQIIKYLIGGGTAAVVDLFFLHIFTDKLKIWYLLSAVLAFIVALGVSFTLQKFWVFNNRALTKVHHQAAMHTALGLFNTGANTVLMFVLVSGIGFHYILAQIIGGAIIAAFNFFVYRKIIFKPEPKKRGSHSLRLLIITQKIDENDDILGFFHNWVKKIAEHFKSVSVICLEQGQSNLPANVTVYSLGKEVKPSRLSYLKNFFFYLVKLDGEYDAVFVHMNQEYMLLAGWWWQLADKRVAFWRNHPQGSWLTNLAVLLADVVFCTSPQAYTARFKKTVVMPAGIDLDQLVAETNQTRKPNSILFLSRISPIKNPHVLVESLPLLKERRVNFSVSFFGNALPKDESYFLSLQEQVTRLHLEDVVSFHPAVPHFETVDIYHQHEIFVNLTPTGSFDKTILEAAVCGTVPIVANQAFAGIWPEEMIFSGQPEDLANKLEYWLKSSTEVKKAATDRLREWVIANHSLDVTLEKIALYLSA